MDSVSTIESLRRHPFLEGLEESDLARLEGLASEVRFARDQFIFREGDHSHSFYLLAEGKVALEVAAPGRTIRIATLGPGDELGWSSILSPSRKHFQARSLEAVRAFAFDGRALGEACLQDEGFGCQIFRRVLGVVAERLQATRLQLLDMYSPAAAPKA